MNGPVTLDPWETLRAHTPARIALGRSGVSLPTAEVLRFGHAHALARDAVHLPLDAQALRSDFEHAGWPTLDAHSAAADRATYLLRPDLGRQLDEASAARLADNAPPEGSDVQIVVGDGLSSMAVSRHALPLVERFKAMSDPSWRFGPVVIALQARVALGDPIGERLRARLVVVLIGERPGLSSPDSLGAYLTHAPRTGRRDAERNCVSNIRPEGLGYEDAARRLAWLCDEALRRGLTGIGLKDMSDVKPLEDRPPVSSIEAR